MITNFKCPNCGESYYTVGPSDVTAMYFEPIYRDGVNINPDRNTITTEVTCLGCGKVYTVSRQYGTPDKIIEKEVKPQRIVVKAPVLTKIDGDGTVKVNTVEWRNVSND